MAKPTLIPKTQTPGFMVFTGLMLLVLSTVVLSLFLNRFEIREENERAPTRRIQDLVALINQAESKRTSLEAEVSQLRKRLLTMEQPQGAPSVTPQFDKTRAQDPEIQKLYELAGFMPVRGSGIVITLTDNKSAKMNNDPHADPNAGKLQADDLLKLVNELKAAGATAISINDQRLVVTSEIVAAGPTISVNQTRLTQPVVVKALGKPDILVNALNIRGGILEYLNFFSIKVGVQKSSRVDLPAYQGGLQ